MEAFIYSEYSESIRTYNLWTIIDVAKVLDKKEIEEYECIKI